MAFIKNRVFIKKNLSQFEAIIRMNSKKTPISLNGHFNKLLLEKDSKGNFKPIRKKMLKARPWFTGTAFAVGKVGKPLSKPIEKEFTYKGKKKTVVFNWAAQNLANADELFICEPKTFGETDYIKLMNLNTDKQILTLGALEEAMEIELMFNGSTKTLKIERRNGGLFEGIEGEKTFSCITDDSAFGLLWRGDGFGYDIYRVVVAVDGLNNRLGVRFEQAGAQARQNFGGFQTRF